jgi:hypothetical protein
MAHPTVRGKLYVLPELLPLASAGWPDNSAVYAWKVVGELVVVLILKFSIAAPKKIRPVSEYGTPNREPRPAVTIV